MATMNISLPDSLKNFAQERANSSDFSNPSDYIRADKQRAAEEKLEQALLEGLSSGPSIPVGNEFWDRLNQRAIGAV